MKLYPLLTCLALSTLPLAALANVEKTIFVAPPPPAHPPALDDLGLDVLAPENPLLRTGLNASFPQLSGVNGAGAGAGAGEDGKQVGEESWFLLEDLSPGVRYEVRVCWLATQPTSFTLSTYTLDEITTNKALLAAISRFSDSRLASPPSFPEPQRKPIAQRQAQAQTQTQTQTQASKRKHQDDRDGAILFLRIDAVADYFSPEESLMQSVAPVVADIILDPFLGNVFPRSLVSTACWGLVVAVVAVVLSRWVVKEMGRVVLLEMRSPEAEKKTK